MSLIESDTDELICRAQAGDEGAVQHLLVRHCERLHRAVAVRMDQRLKARFDPSDIVQEALLTATRKLPEYIEERPVPFYPWLRQIVLERLIDMHRRHLQAEGRSVAREASWTVCDESVMELAQQLVGNGTSPSGRLVRNEMQNRVRRGLTELTSDDRELLLIRFHEQLRVADIATILDISQAAVKSRLRRALERLHDALENDFSEGSE